MVVKIHTNLHRATRCNFVGTDIPKIKLMINKSVSGVDKFYTFSQHKKALHTVYSSALNVLLINNQP